MERQSSLKTYERLRAPWGPEKGRRTGKGRRELLIVVQGISS